MVSTILKTRSARARLRYALALLSPRPVSLSSGYGVAQCSHFSNAEGVIIHILDVAVDLALAQSHLRRQPRPQLGTEIRAVSRGIQVCHPHHTSASNSRRHAASACADIPPSLCPYNWLCDAVSALAVSPARIARKGTVIAAAENACACACVQTRVCAFGEGCPQLSKHTW